MSQLSITPALAGKTGSAPKSADSKGTGEGAFEAALGKAKNAESDKGGAPAPEQASEARASKEESPDGTRKERGHGEMRDTDAHGKGARVSDGAIATRDLPAGPAPEVGKAPAAEIAGADADAVGEASPEAGAAKEDADGRSADAAEKPVKQTQRADQPIDAVISTMPFLTAKTIKVGGNQDVAGRLPDAEIPSVDAVAIEVDGQTEEKTQTAIDATNGIEIVAKAFIAAGAVEATRTQRAAGEISTGASPQRSPVSVGKADGASLDTVGPMAERSERVVTAAAFETSAAATKAEASVERAAPPIAAAKQVSAVMPLAAPADGAKPAPIVLPLDLGRALSAEAEMPASTRETVASHVARVVTTATHGQPVSVLRIQLQPAHLGQVNVTMRLSGEQVHVTLTPDSASAARALSSDHDAITGVLRSLGGSFASASIDVGGEAALRQHAEDASGRSASSGYGSAFGDGGGREFGGDGSGAYGDSGAPGQAQRSDSAADGAEGRIII